MAEDPTPTHTAGGSSTVDDVLNRRIGIEEQPAEGRVDEAQREPRAAAGLGDDDTQPGRHESATHGRPSES